MNGDDNHIMQRQGRDLFIDCDFVIAKAPKGHRVAPKGA